MSLRQDVGREPQLGCSSFNFDSSAYCRRGINREIYRESRAKSTVTEVSGKYNARYIIHERFAFKKSEIIRLRIIPKEDFFFTHGVSSLCSHMF